MRFKRIEAETEKAYLFVDKENEKKWMPKKLCSIIKENRNEVQALVAPFKYEEMTGNEIQLLDAELKWRKPVIREPEIPIIHSEKYELLQAQMDACKFLINQRMSALFAQTRTGKTIIASTVAKSRQTAGVIDNIIVICPVRIMPQWEAYFNEFSVEKFTIYGIEHFSNENTRYKSSKDLRDRISSKTQIIIDESHMVKNKDAVRTELLTDIVGETDCFKIIMSGTPIGKHMGDLYTQFELLDKSILNYSSYGEFERMHLLYGGRSGKKVVGYVNIEEFSYSLQPYIYRLRRADVLKDRPVKKQIEYFDMTEDEYAEYREAVMKSSTYRSNTEVLGAMVEWQMLAGKSKNRLKKLREIIKARPVIFYKFDCEAEILHDELGYPVLNGKTKQKDFLRIANDYTEYRNDGLIVNQSIATGFDLGTAEQIIFYSSLFDYIQKSQAKDRAMNMFNDSELEVVEICCRHTIDEQIVSVLERKGNIKDAFYREIERLKNTEKEGQ